MDLILVLLLAYLGFFITVIIDTLYSLMWEVEDDGQ